MELVSPNEIEEIVGISRSYILHWGRAVSETQIFYILHSKDCVDTGRDLRDCVFSKALSNGVDTERLIQDAPVLLDIDHNGLLVTY